MRIEAETDVFKMDAFRSLRMLAKNDQPFNLILIDPPYEKTDYKRLVEEILAHNLLSKGGIILCEHDLSHELPLLSHQLAIVKQANYGTRSEEHTSELQSRGHLVCRLLLEKKKETLNSHMD